MYEKLKVPLSFTWEIYGDSKADFHDCFRMFNPLQRAEVTPMRKRCIIMEILQAPSSNAITSVSNAHLSL